MKSQRTPTRLQLLSSPRCTAVAGLACVLIGLPADCRGDVRSAYRFTAKPTGTVNSTSIGRSGGSTRSAYRYSSKPVASPWHDLGSTPSTQLPSAYRFAEKAVTQGSRINAIVSIGPPTISQTSFGTTRFTGWQPVGANSLATIAPVGGADNVFVPLAISIALSTTSVHYSHIVGAVDLSADLRCTLTAPGPCAFFLDDREGTMDLHKLPWLTTWKGDSVQYEESGNEFITTDWAVKSITGPEYRDYTPGVYGTIAEGKGVQGLYWVFDRSLPGSVAFNLRNSIHTTSTTPPGQYGQAFHVATGPVL